MTTDERSDGVGWMTWGSYIGVSWVGRRLLVFS